MSKKKLISLLLSMILVFSAVVPVTSAFAADYDVKYHPDDWFGYHHSKEEITEWIKEAVKCPATSEEAIKALTGEIRPGDTISFQLEVEMPTGHKEVIQFLRDFSLNMVFPYGTNAMIEVYASDAPLLTDEEYNQKLSDFNKNIDELEQLLYDEELLKDVEADKEVRFLYNTYKDLVINRDKYYDIYLGQLETARTKYGFADSAYGSPDTWMGAFEDSPDLSLEEGETYESFRDKAIEESWVAPQITAEEFEFVVAEFDEKYPLIVEELMAEYENAKDGYDKGEVSEDDWMIIRTAVESVHDGTFYDTIIKYFEDCRDGYYQYEDDYSIRFIALALTGLDYYNAYFGRYCFKFPNHLVQRNQQLTYIFDINIVATDALLAGGYMSVPVLRWFYEESCPSQHLVSDGSLKFHWEKYYTCNSRKSSFMNLGSAYYANNLMTGEHLSEFENSMFGDKRFFALDYINSEYNDSDYSNKVRLKYGSDLLRENVLKAIRLITVECRDEYGSIIQTDTVETYDAYYSIIPVEIYDYQLVGPEYIKGVMGCEDTTITFNYEHKDAEINVSFVDTDGNELAPAETIKGKTLDEYQANPIDIHGYNLIVIPDNASGVLHEDSADVQFVYKLKAALVSVNYLDTDGKKIANSEMIYGKMFDEYSTEPKEIDGYDLVEVPENAEGVMNEDIISVDYIYRVLYS